MSGQSLNFFFQECWKSNWDSVSRSRESNKISHVLWLNNHGCHLSCCTVFSKTEQHLFIWIAVLGSVGLFMKVFLILYRIYISDRLSLWNQHIYIYLPAKEIQSAIEYFIRQKTLLLKKPLELMYNISLNTFREKILSEMAKFWGTEQLTAAVSLLFLFVSIYRSMFASRVSSPCS